MLKGNIHKKMTFEDHFDRKKPSGFGITAKHGITGSAKHGGISEEQRSK